MHFILLKSIMKPLITRCSGYLSAFLVGAGIAVGTVDTIVLGFTAFAGISIDLISRRYIK